ncbi:TetR/AcrR family transcriptional regulator [Ligilactobacillus acidipiscis]|uniref:Transcriptional regulator, TetR family n=2 Tax=Ligilactobacillus acidipiscis TaxID=89059 RepID=A0A1K1KRC0_9LACO|nr:TetR/AcrR family transcriptional regulator [Ligilactobacillus acidipiscis]SFV41449.1 Transcriptional regulator, TetR family [Ligilactobacillus acidipiscis]
MSRIGKITNTEQKIMSAFWQLYQEKKISQITVREVIELADCNRSTFYAYFADMYDLLDKFEEQLLPDLTQPAVKKIIAKDDISLSVQHCMALYQKYKDYYQVLLGANGDPAFRGKLTDILDQMIKAHLGQRKGQTNFEVDFLVETTASILLTALIFYFKRSDRPKAAEIIALLTNVLNQGVASQLGWHISCQEKKQTGK